MKNLKIVFCLSFLCIYVNLEAQLVEKGLIYQSSFLPQYQLLGNAANRPGFSSKNNNEKSVVLMENSKSLLRYNGQEPTASEYDCLDFNDFPQNQFTIEMWVLDHVNQPVGVNFAVNSQRSELSPSLLFGYYGKKIDFLMHKPGGRGKDFHLQYQPEQRGYKNYWYQLVATYDSKEMELYVNGELVETIKTDGRIPFQPKSYCAINAYLENEPYMSMPNLLQQVNVYNRKLKKKEVRNNFAFLQEKVDNGFLHSDLFHFNAPPYLNAFGKDSISLVWETDRPAKAMLFYGEELPLTQFVMVNQMQKIQKAVISNLKTGTPYFYEVIAIDEAQDSLKSGVLTFKTAVEADEAFSFGIIADTESRPHINHQISTLLWDERPNFILNMGDLTDGGKEHHKFEWNHEYFVGMGAIASRIPILAVPGNGEGDLFWYNQYHHYEQPTDYHHFEFGNAAFFFLNSNKSKTDFQPGGEQYEWLKAKLEASTATWKFVGHHHPTYTSEENDYGDSWTGVNLHGDTNVQRIVPLYEKYGVDMVFFGHLHLYERTWPLQNQKVDNENGVVYILTGGAGGNLEDFAPNPTYFKAKSSRQHHYCTVKINGKELFFQMHGLDGAVRDYLHLKK